MVYQSGGASTCIRRFQSLTTVVLVTTSIVGNDCVPFRKKLQSGDYWGCPNNLEGNLEQCLFFLTSSKTLVSKRYVVDDL